MSTYECYLSMKLQYCQSLTAIIAMNIMPLYRAIVLVLNVSIAKWIRKSQIRVNHLEFNASMSCPNRSCCKGG